MQRSTEFTWPRTRAGEAEAREALGGVLPDGAGGLAERAMLLLSEVFSAERPLGSADVPRVGVKVGAEESSVRIEVRDAGSGFVLEALRQPSLTGRAGWSPHLLSSIADRWGLVSGESGAWVWFELDYPQG